MTAAARRVRHLRLRAGSAQAVRRVLPALEDALRTASLPDSGGRLLLVRRLALGRIAADAAPASLALALERAVAAARLDGLPAEAAAAADAPAVWFRDPLHAHVALARRLLEGPPPREWFWPLAVPAWSPAQALVPALQAVLAALAARPEAAVAVPAWFAALAARGHGARLRALAGAPAGPAPAASCLERPTGPGSVPARAAAAAPTPESARPRRAAPDAATPAGAVIATPSAVPGAGPAAAAPSPARPAARGAADPVAPAVTAVPARRRRASTAPASRPADPPAETPAGPATAIAAAAPPAAVAATDPAPPRPTSSSRAAWPATAVIAAPPAFAAAGWDGLPTVAGGLAFVLPALARLGLPAWLAAAGRDDAEAGRLVAGLLAALLARLVVPADDPAWTLAGTGPLPSLPAGLAPPPAWAALARRDGRAVTVAGAGPATPRWLAGWACALRRWLRRDAGLGLASLVLRPGRLALTATHLDLRFPLAAVDLRVRRAGLDLDPGWLPWFGRVVGFHYEAPP